MVSLKEVMEHFSYETRRILKNKFLRILIVVILYFIFASWHFGLKDGFFVMLLTWTFFVLATPIADGGIILDLPIRYFTGVKMVISEIFVWIFAIGLNLYFIFFNIEMYDKTLLLTVFKDILVNPIPYWLIIFLSCIGTFFSLYFGDELYDALKNSKRHEYDKHKIYFKVFIFVSLIVFVIILYEILLKHFGIKFI